MFDEGRVLMLNRFFLATVVSLSSTSLPAKSAPREPVGKWVVDYDLAQCVASRNYGTTSKPLWLVLKAPPVGNVMQVALLQQSKAPAGYKDEARIVLDDERTVKVSVLAYRPEGAKLRTYLMNLPVADFQPARSAKRLSVRFSGVREDFALTNMEPLLKTMDDCVADLRGFWNVSDSDALGSTHKERASADLSKLFDSSDYPQAAARIGAEGSVRVAMLIDETGRLSDCSVTETSGVALLDAQACALIKKRAKFRSAVGADGKPAKDALLQRIVWRVGL